jgi:hypothetical protein
MNGLIELVPPILAVSAVAYVVLAIHVGRSEPNSNKLVSVFLALVAGMVAGAAFSFNADSVTMYSIGRTLGFFSAGFIPVVFFLVYREYTVGPPGSLLVSILIIIPVVTTGLALTNSMHNMIWAAFETESGLVFSDMSSHSWYRNVYAPFTYGLFAYSAIALVGRLPTIAVAHRKMIGMLLCSTLLPFAVSIANNFLGIGPPDFPFTTLSLTLLFPFIAYASLRLRMHESIICVNNAARALLKGSERELIGRKLWEDFPEARAILEQARELDLTQTLRMDTNNIYEVSVGPLTGHRGETLGMVVVCRDVTERRLALSQLADSEHLVRTLIETSSNGILRFSRDENDADRGYHCVFANRAA